MNKLLRQANNAGDAANFRFVQRALEQRRRQTVKQKTTGRYIDYNSRKRAHRIKLLNGGTIFSTSITNAGNQGGDRVVVSEDGQFFKSMPRS